MAEPRDELDREILALHSKGLTDVQMAKALGKARTAVQSRVKRLGLQPHSAQRTHAALVEQRTTSPP